MPDKESESQVDIQVSCPERWKWCTPRFTKIAEASCYVGLHDFRLHFPVPLKFVITPSSEVYMEADWSVNRIDMGLPFHPIMSVWVFSLYFGMAHEIGHLLWHTGPLTLREAWAHYFALYVLQSLSLQQHLFNQIDRLLLRKDFWLSLNILRVRIYARNPVTSGIANMVRLFRNSEKEHVSAFFNVIEDLSEKEYTQLTNRFSQYFDVPEPICKVWLRGDLDS